MTKLIILMLILFQVDARADKYSKESIAIMRNIKCPICNGQSIYDSNNEFSKQMREVTVKLFQQNKGQQEIENFFIKEFGRDIIINNREPKVLYILYTAPIILLIFLAYLFLFRSKKPI